MRRKQSIIKWTGMCLAITMLAGCGSRGDTSQAIAEAETQTQQATEEQSTEQSQTALSEEKGLEQNWKK